MQKQAQWVYLIMGFPRWGTVHKNMAQDIVSVSQPPCYGMRRQIIWLRSMSDQPLAKPFKHWKHFLWFLEGVRSRIAGATRWKLFRKGVSSHNLHDSFPGVNLPKGSKIRIWLAKMTPKKVLRAIWKSTRWNLLIKPLNESWLKFLRTTFSTFKVFREAAETLKPAFGG